MQYSDQRYDLDKVNVLGAILIQETSPKNFLDVDHWHSDSSGLQHVTYSGERHTQNCTVESLAAQTERHIVS